MSAMAISIKPLHPLFGAEIGQVDIGRPLDDAMFAEIRGAFEEYSLLLFRDQELDGPFVEPTDHLAHVSTLEV